MSGGLHLLLWPRQDSDSGPGVVMFSARFSTLLILSSLSLSFRISEHKQQIHNKLYLISSENT